MRRKGAEIRFSFPFRNVSNSWFRFKSREIPFGPAKDKKRRRKKTRKPPSRDSRGRQGQHLGRGGPLVITLDIIYIRRWLYHDPEERERERGCRARPATALAVPRKTFRGHSFAEEAKVANYRRRLNASHYDGSYSAPFLPARRDSTRRCKVHRPLRKSSEIRFPNPLRASLSFLRPPPFPPL